jgi:hypothetical protein
VGGERWAAHLVGVDRHLVAIAEVRRARAAGLQAREQQQRQQQEEGQLPAGKRAAGHRHRLQFF